MQKINVDYVQPHALQTLVATLMHVFRPAIGRLLAIGQIDIAELGGDHHVVAPAFQRAREQHLMARAPVRIGAVEKINAQIQRAMNRRIEIIDLRCVELNRGSTPPHADGGNLRAISTQSSVFHNLSFISICF